MQDFLTVRLELYSGCIFMNIRSKHYKMTGQFGLAILLLISILLLFCFQHPNIPASILSTANESGGIVIRPSYEKGTLRDLICKCRPQGHYLRKYASPSKTSALDFQSIKLFGKQILETLNLLHEKGLPYGRYLYSFQIQTSCGAFCQRGIENLYK